MRILVPLLFLLACWAAAAAPCVHEGVTLGRLEDGPECAAVIKAVRDIWAQGSAGPHCTSRKCMGRALEKSLLDFASGHAHARLRCTLRPGFDVELSGWTHERCDQARRYLEVCLAYDFTINACLGGAIAGRDLDPQWIGLEQEHEEWWPPRIITIRAG